VIDNLQDGRNLYLIGTGTGLAPFLSVIKDPETYERFEKVVLLHGCRRVAELAYGEMITEKLPQDDLIGDLVRSQLIYYRDARPVPHSRPHHRPDDIGKTVQRCRPCPACERT
jgi:ferredoxin-NADP reductase